jgi:hypothetical protein
MKVVLGAVAIASGLATVAAISGNRDGKEVYDALVCGTQAQTGDPFEALRALHPKYAARAKKIQATICQQNCSRLWKARSGKTLWTGPFRLPRPIGSASSNSFR